MSVIPDTWEAIRQEDGVQKASKNARLRNK
jgi:hypothetical protein